MQAPPVSRILYPAKSILQNMRFQKCVTEFALWIVGLEQFLEVRQLRIKGLQLLAWDSKKFAPMGSRLEGG